MTTTTAEPTAYLKLQDDLRRTPRTWLVTGVASVGPVHGGGTSFHIVGVTAANLFAQVEQGGPSFPVLVLKQQGLVVNFGLNGLLPQLLFQGYRGFQLGGEAFGL